jgi:hypothetical protein
LVFPPNIDSLNILNLECDNSDFSVAKYQTPSSILKNDSNQFSIFPNPSHGEFEINITDKESFTSIKIFDVSGKLILSTPIENQNPIKIKAISTGIYNVQIIGKQGNLVRKILVQ